MRHAEPAQDQDDGDTGRRRTELRRRGILGVASRKRRGRRERARVFLPEQERHANQQHREQHAERERTDDRRAPRERQEQQQCGERDDRLRPGSLRDRRHARDLGIEGMRWRLRQPGCALLRGNPFVERVQEQPHGDQHEGGRDDELELVALVDAGLADAARREQAELLVSGRDLLEELRVEAVGEREGDDGAERRRDRHHDAPDAIGQEPTERVDREVPALARRVTRAEQRGPDRAVHQHVARRVERWVRDVKERCRRLDDRDEHHHADDDEAQARLGEQDAAVEHVERAQKWGGFCGRGGSGHGGGAVYL